LEDWSINFNQECKTSENDVHHYNQHVVYTNELILKTESSNFKKYVVDNLAT